MAETSISIIVIPGFSPKPFFTASPIILKESLIAFRVLALGGSSSSFPKENRPDSFDFSFSDGMSSGRRLARRSI